MQLSEAKLSAQCHRFSVATMTFVSAAAVAVKRFLNVITGDGCFNTFPQGICVARRINSWRQKLPVSVFGIPIVFPGPISIFMRISKITHRVKLRETSGGPCGYVTGLIRWLLNEHPSVRTTNAWRPLATFVCKLS
jgi:hypothetical protein